MKNSKYQISILALIFWILGGCATTPTRQQPMETQSTCQEGTTRQGFISPTTSGDLSCPTGVQTCLSGQWQGQQLFDSCDNMTKSCEGSPHGSVVTGYMQPTSPHGVPCTPATKTCINGSWTGHEVFASCTEFP